MLHLVKNDTFYVDNEIIQNNQLKEKKNQTLNIFYITKLFQIQMEITI